MAKNSSAFSKYLAKANIQETCWCLIRKIQSGSQKVYTLLTVFIKGRAMILWSYPYIISVVLLITTIWGQHVNKMWIISCLKHHMQNAKGSPISFSLQSLLEFTIKRIVGASSSLSLPSVPVLPKLCKTFGHKWGQGSFSSHCPLGSRVGLQ